MEGLKLRRAISDDANKIKHGLEFSFIPMMDRYYKNGYYPYFANLKWITDKIENEYVYVCEHKGEIIGGIILCKNPDASRLKLHTVYVDISLRNQGIGAFIIESAEKLHPNVMEWKLETLMDLRNNRHLYEKLGYVQEGIPKIVNERVTIVYYVKQVSQP